MHDPTVPPRHVNFGPFELDVRSGELRKGSTRLKVPDQSIEILKALVEHPGELVTREDLRERLWPANTFVDFEHGLNAAIRRLREALGDSADAPKYIETLPRRGYRFIGSVEAVPAFVAVPQSPAHIESPPAEPVEPPARTFVNVGRLTAGHPALMVLIVLTVGIGLYFIRKGSDRPTHDAFAPVRSTPVTSLPNSEVDPNLSPDGKWVAFAWDGESGDNFDIYVKQLDVGAGHLRLTTDAAEDRAPAWSPDDQEVVFVRRHGNEAVAILVPRSGGAETTLTGITGLMSGLSWTPDGKCLVFVGRDESSTRSAVFSYSRETGERRRLTQPTPTPAGIPDTAAGQLSAAPVISPDSKYLAYIGNRWNIVVQRLDDTLRPVGAPKPLTEGARVVSLTWAHDSGSIIYSYWDGEVPGGLWRVPTAGGLPLPVFPIVRALRPSIAGNGRPLVYQRTTTDKNIWIMPSSQRNHEAESGTAPDKFIASNEFDMSPQISPDGRRVVFVSTRSGHYELWVSNTDSPASAHQLTHFEGPFVGSPRWNAAGDLIAFDSNRFDSANIWVVGGDGTGVLQITNDSSENARPSWSRDGQWIYYSSKRSGDLQIWKVPASRGQPVQVTKKGEAIEAFESPDGKHLYYAKPGPLRGIWRVPVDGGDEVQVIDYGMAGWWAVIDGGIVLLNKDARPRATVKYFSLDPTRIMWTRQLPPGLHFDLNPGFAVSRDGQWMLFVQLDNWGSDIHMLQDSR